MTPTDLVKAYYSAFGAKDFRAARAVMHDRFRFSGPMMEASSPEDLFEKMQTGDYDIEHNILHLAEDGQTVAVLFDCVFSSPFHATVRMSEWFTVEDGKISSADLVYDTRLMPQPTEP